MSIATTAPDERHARAVTALILGLGDGSNGQDALRRGAEEAVRMLEEIARETPSEPVILSDLAAAYLVRGQRLDQPSDLVSALEHAEHASQVEPGFENARFNQALLRQKLGLQEKALQAWESYRMLDDSSKWAAEARQNLARLRAPVKTWDDVHENLNASNATDLVGKRRSESRQWVQDEVLPSWARAENAHAGAAAEVELGKARLVAAALLELNGDRSLADAVQVIEDASPSLRQKLAAGHRAYGDAARYWSDLKCSAAAPLYRAAAEELRSAGSPFAGWADIGLATCRGLQAELDEALAILQEVRRRHAGQGRHSILAKAAWVSGFFLSLQGRPLEGLKTLESSLAVFNELGEAREVCAVHSRIADAFRHLGERREGWRHRYQALQQGHLQSLRERSQQLSEMSGAVLDTGNFRAALTIQEEAVALSRSLDDEPSFSEMLRHRAEARLHVGLRSAARADLREASRLAESISDRAVREIALMQIAAVEGKSHLDPVQAARSFGRALDYLSTNGYKAYKVNLLLLRAQAWRSAGDFAAAEVDLWEGLELLEDQWENVLDKRRRGEKENLWNDYFDHAQETFDLMIRQLVESGEDDRALSYAERARGRDLLGLIADTEWDKGMRDDLRPLSAEEIHAALPDDRLLLEYVLLDDKLLIWVIRRNTSELFVRPAGRRQVEALVEELRRYSRSDRTVPVHSVLQDLHELLVGGLLEDVGEDEEIVFLPDEMLHEVPFAALKDPVSGRFLIEDHVLSVSPSATFHLYALQRRQALGAAMEKKVSALIVGDPAFGKADVPAFLERLPEAVLEAEQVADMYPGSRVLLAEEATKERFLAEMDEGYPIVHFAGHAISNSEQPFLSALIMASAEDASPILYAQELLAKDNLSATRLVVFSACSTAGGHAIGALATAGLVRPVLGAGVPAVLGTLWDVRSSAAREILTLFHSRFKEGEEASWALREAQLEVLKKNRGRAAIERWAPFQLIGTTFL